MPRGRRVSPASGSLAVAPAVGALLLLISGAAVALSGCAPSKPPGPEASVENWLVNRTEKLPPRLSQTGAFSSLDTAQPSGSMRGYDVRWARWADGNRAQRLVYLPPDSQIDNSDPNEWVFPAGTAFFQTWFLPTATVPVETRVLYKNDSTWRTGTYRWDTEEAEARLVEGIEEEKLRFDLPDGPYNYTFHRNFDCLTCHRQAGEYVLGFRALQLDTGEGGGLAELAADGVFSAEPTAHEPISGSTELESSVLAYFEANCSHCHRPGAVVHATTELDLRHSTAVGNVVDVAPLRLGTTDPEMRLVVPGDPDKSLLYILTTGAYPDPALAMPQLGVSVIDSAANGRLREWIESL